MLMAGQSTETDILCLKSIKNSLEDPNNYLQNWNFNNNTESFICGFNGVECWHPYENRVLTLKLSNMGLKGQFPRGLQNCSSLTDLDFSFNELSGPIPSDIARILTFIINFDLSNNMFTDEIPMSLANCTYLNVLKLNNNMLSGEIPMQLAALRRLKEVSFANNYLSGPVPLFSTTVDSNYVNNSGICGGSLRPCPLRSDKCSDFLHSFKSGLIVGYVFSLTCSVMLTFMFYSKCVQFKKKNNYVNKAKELGKYVCSIVSRRTQVVVNQVHKYLQPRLEHKEIKEISVLFERLTSTIWLEELREVTDCFAMDNAIGVGKMGMMYQGKLRNGQLLAVKRLFDSKMFKKQFLLETMILGRYKHKNIVPLLGFCIEENERLLAYTYMSNGRLSKWLHPLKSEVKRLKWPERANIALGIARGLSWLHHTCDLGIVHFNICSECILLDDNFEPKISNFGEAKFMNPNIEDDLGITFKVHDGKKDVYDFGSVLFELITGKTYNELTRSSTTTDFYDNPSNFYNAIDKSLTGEGFEKEVCAVLKIACECVKPTNQRPTMLEVHNNLSNVMKAQYGTSDDSNSTGGLEIASDIIIEEIVEL
ncbi:hypothetical protein TSUD_65220 [Trifolium subterraneum]|uniref:Protein kinase domain-containing protein n=1 Tax=Trifolium subterraneum TaxID=3900 RepID=A0A2Z6MAE8_TRISU|nr:hypothetical protein TSUD_65220 [Trifolium subterraneum]